jgi:hypothetical protein
MNLAYQYLNFPTPPVPAAATYDATMTEPLLIKNAWQIINQRFLDAQNFVNALTATLSNLETAQANGTLDRCAAAMLNGQSANGAGFAQTIIEHAALSNIATGGPLLLAAATALYLTPAQTTLTEFESTYETVLHRYGLI